MKSEALISLFKRVKGDYPELNRIELLDSDNHIMLTTMLPQDQNQTNFQETKEITDKEQENGDLNLTSLINHTID